MFQRCRDPLYRYFQGRYRAVAGLFRRHGRRFEPKASEALIDASSGGGIRNVAVTAPKAGVEISSGAVVKGVSLDVTALTCQASSGAVATLEHTGNNSMLNTSSGGVIRITGSTGS